jgi:competence protein ComEA
VEEGSLLKRLSVFDILVIGLMGLGVTFLFFSFRGKVLGEKVQVEYLSSDTGAQLRSGMVFVDVSGAVMRPGVYELEEGSRLKDALVAAGGLSESADREWVGRVLNMAEEIGDGEKVFIPEISKNQNIETSNQNSNNETSNLVDINSASEAELDELWGVGLARAAMIIESRPYKSIEELLAKKVLPENVYEANKEKISVY